MSGSPPERKSTKELNPATLSPVTDAFWQLPGEEMLRRLGSSENGLSPREAAARLLREEPTAPPASARADPGGSSWRSSRVRSC